MTCDDVAIGTGEDRVCETERPDRAGDLGYLCVAVCTRVAAIWNEPVDGPVDDREFARRFVLRDRLSTRSFRAGVSHQLSPLGEFRDVFSDPP